MSSNADQTAKIAALEAALAARDREIIALSQELDETNRGVVALYAELDDKAAALREATELKSRFLNYMSHEFKTPLSAVRSMIRILFDRMDGPLTDEQAKQLEFINGSVVELSEMVNDLLDLARIEAGRVAISAEWFEMVDLFAALRGMFKPLLSESSVALILEEPIHVPRIFTDDKKLSQILRNYISNALKFTSQGQVRVSVNRHGEDHVKFEVIDTGIGIAPEFHGAIFQDFMQIDSALQKKWRGTGLGLSLCKRLAQLLGGEVGMTSEPNRGSTFWATIPIHYNELPPHERNPLAAADSQGQSHAN
jgi:signal transduction histidine kinase